jgi:hypothetical protein
MSETSNSDYLDYLSQPGAREALGALFAHVQQPEFITASVPEVTEADNETGETHE